MKRHLLVAALIGVAAAACGDSSTEATANVSGSWTYTGNNISGGGALCSFNGVAMNLTQTDSTFAGTVTSGTVSCGSAGGSSSSQLGAAPVLNGKVRGSKVEFDIATSSIHNTGEMKGGKVSGDVTINSGGVLFKGTFTLEKK